MLAPKKDMPVSLEAVAQQVEASAETPDGPAHPEVQAPEPPSEPPSEPPPERPSEPPSERPSEPPDRLAPPEVQAPPAPKRRGRPPKADAEKAKAKPKAATKRAPRAPPPPDYGKLESSDNPSNDDEPLSRDDMETMLLSYLVQRKNQQIDKRRQMWTRLAGLG